MSYQINLNYPNGIVIVKIFIFQIQEDIDTLAKTKLSQSNVKHNLGIIVERIKSYLIILQSILSHELR